MDRGTLRKFLAMEAVPRPDNLEKIHDWAADRPEVWVPLGAVALGVLVLDFPAHLRAAVRRGLARELASAYVEAELPVPEWLDQECDG